MTGPTSFDTRSFRDACGAFATGVTVVSAVADDTTSGMTANAFMSISLEPPLIAVSLGLKARTLSVIRAAGRFGVAILPADAEQVAWHFAGRRQEELDAPFEMVDGVPLARAASAAFVATLETDMLAGDHAILIGHVSALRHREGTEPLLFHCGRFGRLAGEHAGPMRPEVLRDHMWWGFGATE